MNVPLMKHHKWNLKKHRHLQHLLSLQADVEEFPQRAEIHGKVLSLFGILTGGALSANGLLVLSIVTVYELLQHILRPT